jgi:hypothetical protein
MPPSASGLTSPIQNLSDMLHMSGEILGVRGLKTSPFLGLSMEHCEGPYGMDSKGLYS